MAKNSPEDRFHDARDRAKRHQAQLPTEDDPALPPAVEPIKGETKPKRNDPCSCGSGRKYKQCCGKAG